MFIITPVNTIQDPERGTDRDGTNSAFSSYSTTAGAKHILQPDPLIKKMERKSEEVTHRGKKKEERKTKQKNPTHMMKDQQNLNNPSLSKQSYELHFLCSTLDINCRKGKVRGCQLHL